MMAARLVLAGLVLSLGAHVLCAQGTGTVSVGWYNGDRQDGIPGQANWYVSDQQFSRTFDNFVVPAGGWTVAAVFSVNTMSVAGVSEAVWEIRSGVSVGSGGSVVASGRSPATQKLMATLPDGETVYRVEVDGLGAKLAAGTYWLNVSPVIAQWSPAAVGAPSYVGATTGVNAAGNPAGTDGNAFYNSVAPPQAVFQPVRNTGALGSSGDFSQGVLISGGLGASPVIAAVVSAADWQGGAVSPGEVVTIVGTALGPVQPATLTLDQNGGVATLLGGVQVLFSGVAAPLTYVSSTQINAVVPYEFAGVANPSVQIRISGQGSNVFPLKLAAATPALFTADGSGAGPAAALNQDNSYNLPGRAAAKGDYVVLFLTGEGLTNAAVTGRITTVSAAPPLTPQPLLSPVSVLVGGVTAPVAFYGEAPGMVAGVLQVNAQIPANVPAGNLAISVSVGGIATQKGVTISVQ